MPREYTIHGELASPYSMKTRAVLRYRRIPHVWHQLRGGDDGILQNVRVPVIPIVQFPDGTWHNDSTPLIFALEALHRARSIVPEHRGQAFLARLLEDFADEWGTKVMFHYRWFREPDQRRMSEWISFDRLSGSGRAAILAAAEELRARQILRMDLVGCTKDNAPLIEATGRQILELFEAHVTEDSYLFGTRPSLADFGWFGQLSQLTVDPTPQEMMRQSYPFTYRWIANLDDASGVEGDWRNAHLPQPALVAGLLALAAEVYMPFLAANAAAFDRGADRFEVEIQGTLFSQGTFKYQRHCLRELQSGYAALDQESASYVNRMLEESGCLSVLRGC